MPFYINRIAFIPALLFIALSGFTQNTWRAEGDSLLKVLHTQKDDSAKVITLITAGVHYEANNPDSAVYYYKQAGNLSEKLHYNYGKLRYLACMTEIFETQANYDTALQYCTQGIALAKKIHNRHALAAMYNNAASIYGDAGNPEKVLEYYQYAVEIFEGLKNKIDTANLATVYSNILAVYSSLEQHEKAYSYGLKAVALSRSAGDNDALLVGLINLNDVLIKMNRYDTAMLVAKEVLALGSNMNDNPSQVKALGDMNRVYLETGNIAPVLTNAVEMERLSLATKDVSGLASAYFFKASYYFQIKGYGSAKKFALQELNIVDSNSLKGANEIEVHQLLSDIGLATGNLAMFNNNRRITDSLQNFYTSNKILKYTQELQAKYSLDKKQSEIEGLKNEKEIQQLTISQRNVMSIVLAGIVIAIVCISILFYRNYRQKSNLLLAEDVLKQQRITELEKEKQLLAAESVLQGQDEERKRLAKDLHDGLGGILSSAKYSFTHMKSNLIISEENAEAFDRSMGMLDKSITELRRVAHNMMPEALVNFGLDTALKDFCHGINQSGALQLTCQSFELHDDTIPKSKASVVFRIIQELVNNILKHANATAALVQVVCKNGELSITVEDNGNGFDTDILLSSNGIGYANLHNRVAYLSGAMDVQTAPGKGASIHIEIPNITL